MTLRVRDISLRDALDRLAATANVRISYSAAFLPLDRRSCVLRERITVGDALIELLHATALRAVVAGADHIILAPDRGNAREAAAPATEERAVALDRMVVTGSAAGAPERQLSVALATVTHQQLVRHHFTTLADALNTAVPGMWMWGRTPEQAWVRYGSIRGASSFGATHPKIYIDGIEVVNPVLVSHLDPEAVERIEVIRGPQGAALYGSDAMSGVINIVLRHEGRDTGAPRVRLRSRIGRTESEFATGTVVAHDHAVTWRAGTGPRTRGLTVSFGTPGSYVRGTTSRHLSAGAGLRLVGTRTVFTGSARLFVEDGAASMNPVVLATLAAGLPPAEQFLRRVSVDQRTLQHTVGASLTYYPGGRWVHTVLAGSDGADLRGTVGDLAVVPSLAGLTSSRAPHTTGNRMSARWSSVARFGDDRALAGTLTLVAEQSLLRETIRQELTSRPSIGGGSVSNGGAAGAEWRASGGVVAQTDLALRRRLHVTAGVRAEGNGALLDERPVVVLPMVGASLVHEQGNVTAKLRAAYGSGIRGARTSVRQMTWAGIQTETRQGEPGPERQTGMEAGVDLRYGRPLSLQITRYEQRASGLIQRIYAAPQPRDLLGFGAAATPYEMQTAGDIVNRGWEMQGAVELRRLALGAAVTIGESRVERIAAGYLGDLLPQDRVPEVPARTIGLTASWADRGWTAAVAANRASDWIAHDPVALLEDLSRSAIAGAVASPSAGTAWLRSYRRAYYGRTRLRASLERSLSPSIGAALVGENLLNVQSGEPDRTAIMPGRTLGLRLRARF